MDRLLPRPLLVVLTLLAMTLAGCAGNGGGPGSGLPTPSGSVPTPEEARDLLEQAAGQVPDRVAAKAQVAKGSRTLLQLNGSFDNVTGVTFVEVRGDADALNAASGGGGGLGAAGMGQVIADGLTLYATPQGALYYANGTAFTLPPLEGGDESGGLVPHPSETPFVTFLDPRTSLEGLVADNVSVKSVKPTTHRGQAALEITLTRGGDDNGTVEATAILFTSPLQLARIEGDAPGDSGNAADPFAGARFEADFFYGDAARLDVPPALSRAIALSYRSDQNPFTFGPPRPYNWTFLVSGGVALDQVEVQLKDAHQDEVSDATQLAGLPTLWSMRLSEGSRNESGVSLTFTDVDGDGKVSQGDRLHVAFEGEAPVLVLRDLETGAFVVPAPALGLLLVGFAAAALLVRRR